MSYYRYYSRGTGTITNRPIIMCATPALTAACLPPPPVALQAGGLGFSLGLRHVASVQRQGEAARYRPFECLPNKMLLWHGVRPRLPPPRLGLTATVNSIAREAGTVQAGTGSARLGSPRRLAA